MAPPDLAERVLVALDVEGLAEAAALLDRLSGVLRRCKIGSQLFTAAGPAAVELARKRGFGVFLDLKFHDIPHTVTGAVREATRLGVFMLNVHASGGVAMMAAAASAATKAAADFGVPRPLCLGVTVVTSLDRRALDVELGVPSTVEAHVLHLAWLAREAGLDGCVASPREIAPLRLALGRQWVIVTPGIRGVQSPAGQAAVPGPEVAGPGGHLGENRGLERPGADLGENRGSESHLGEDRRLGGPGGHLGAPRYIDDQARTATPAAAIRAGADYLVVGRPITAAPDPAAAARALLEECAQA